MAFIKGWMSPRWARFYPVAQEPKGPQKHSDGESLEDIDETAATDAFRRQLGWCQSSWCRQSRGALGAFLCVFASAHTIFAKQHWRSSIRLGWVHRFVSPLR